MLRGVGPEAVPEPVPVRPIICGLAGALSMTPSDAVLVPSAVGVNVIVSEQLAPAATFTPEHMSCVTVKSTAAVPVCDRPLTNRGAVPVLSTETVCGGLACPVGSAGKASDAGLSVTAGDVVVVDVVVVVDDGVHPLSVADAEVLPSLTETPHVGDE